MSEPMPQLFLQILSDSQPKDITLKNEKGKILYHDIHITDVNGVYRSTSDSEVSFTMMGKMASFHASLCGGRCLLCYGESKLDVQIQSINFHQDIHTARTLVDDHTPILMNGMVTATLYGVVFNSEDLSEDLTSFQASDDPPHEKTEIQDTGYDNPFELLDFNE